MTINAGHKQDSNPLILIRHITPLGCMYINERTSLSVFVTELLKTSRIRSREADASDSLK